MKRIEALAADYWIENYKRIYNEDLHVSGPVMDAYEAGFKKARDLAVERFKQSRQRYKFWLFNLAFKCITIDLETLGEEHAHD